MAQEVVKNFEEPEVRDQEAAKSSLDEQLADAGGELQPAGGDVESCAWCWKRVCENRKASIIAFELEAEELLQGSRKSAKGRKLKSRCKESILCNRAQLQEVELELARLGSFETSSCCCGGGDAWMRQVR